ncbi:TspO/MBR family protein [Halalkalibacillus halophilus]|uniref:TspO/MBR family protein n=1 Tax=Halalkalibacillus halophilus TaxID=392827 RepID=UPI0004003CEB|nr:TspO/MBR family protein [Halalkalibacillus halophilus]
MQSTQKLAIFNVFALLIVLFINYLSNSLPLNGQTAGDISDRLNVLFTPAGYVFSIWGIIYFLLIVWMIGQFVSINASNVIQTVGPWFIISCLFNVSWLFAFHFEYFSTSLLVMILLLFSLIVIYRKLQKQTTPRAWQIPFSVYLGWVSVATIVNVGVVFASYGLEFFGTSSIITTIILIFLATSLAVWFTISKKDIIYPLVFIWAFIGIAVERVDYTSIFYTAWAMVIVLSAFVLTQFARWIK